MVRRHVADRTRVGLLAAEYVARHELLPDDLMIDMLHEPLLSAHGYGGLILDGFPRRLSAMEWLSRQPYAPPWLPTWRSMLS